MPIGGISRPSQEAGRQRQTRGDPGTQSHGTRAGELAGLPIVTVTVKAGDSLSGIASAHKLTLKALLAFVENAKYRAKPGLIHPGDIVRVKWWTASPARFSAESPRCSSPSSRR